MPQGRMEVHCHGHETLGMNKEADKVYSPEFQDKLAPPSSQIPDAGTASNASFTFPPPTSAPDVPPMETNPHSHECVVLEEPSEHVNQAAEQEEAFDDMVILEDAMVNSAIEETSGHVHQAAEQEEAFDDVVLEEPSEHVNQAAEQEEAFDDMVILEDGMVTSAIEETSGHVHQAAEQEEAFDDMVILEDGMVTSASMSSGGAGATMEYDRLLPVSVVSEVTAVSGVSVQGFSVPVSMASQPVMVEASISCIGAVESAIPAVEPSEPPPDVDKEGYVSAEQSPNGDTAEAKVPEATDTTAHPAPGVVYVSADNDPPPDVVSAEDIQAIKGQKVVKKFGRNNFAGEVIDFDPETKWFKVIYEDGDKEDLELWEVKLILASSTNQASSSKKRSRAERGTDEIAKKDKQKAYQTGAESTTKKRWKSVATKSSAKSPKSPGARAKGSKIVSKTGQSPGKAMKKDSSDFKTPDSTQGTGDTRRGKIRSITPKSSKGGSSRKRTSAKNVSRSLHLQALKTERDGKCKASAESSETQRAANSPGRAKDTPKQPASGAKCKAPGIETMGSKAKKPKKGAVTKAEESTRGGEAIHMGKHVKKDFGGVIYSGVVLKFDQKTQYYKVKYEDGDQEELELHELAPILVQEIGSAQVKEKEEPTAK